MSNQQVKTVPAEKLCASLETLPGVRRAVVDGPTGRVYLICEPFTGDPATEESARDLIASFGLGSDEMALEMSYLASPHGTGRVRFVRLNVERPRVGVVEARVTLEWMGTTFDGAAEGEGGSASELRVCAQASVRALEAVVGGDLVLTLVGSKAIRIFDDDLVSVLLHSPQAEARKLIGVSLVAGDPNRSASLAVLNATNRLLGNYLPAPE